MAEEERNSPSLIIKIGNLGELKSSISPLFRGLWGMGAVVVSHYYSDYLELTVTKYKLRIKVSNFDFAKSGVGG